MSIKSTIKKTSIGGQALIEGVMMRGPRTSAMAVRKPDGTIHTETWDSGAIKWYAKLPFVRGIFNLFSMLAIGYKCLMKSAEISGADEDETPSKFELWLDKHLGDNVTWIFNVLVSVVAAVIAIGLFMLLPAALVKFIGSAFSAPGYLLTIAEGILKIAIFVLYLYGVSRTKDIHRVFQYHGAEHKTIACYEAGDELTPENAMKYPRFHPRCGTSFMLIVLIISIIVFSVVTWNSLLMRVALKIIMLPIVVGISYEIIRYSARNDNALTRAIIKPGLWLQNFTTFEPDTSMLAVAIESMKPCIPENEDEDRI